MPDQTPGQLTGRNEVGLEQFGLFQIARLLIGALFVLIKALADLSIQLAGQHQHDLEVDQALDHRLVQTGRAAHFAVLGLDRSRIATGEFEVPG